ncbi:MAG: CsgG/HfaB family protein, partial [Sulfurimonas sp.]|nr:CsgG/HfaB family protein [Sulfurimonas sp.]
MHRYILIIQIVLVSLFISGCTQKVRIKALEPAEIDRASSMKRIAVLKFENDIVGLSAKIESNLAKHTIENKPFFTVLNRNDIDKIIDELNLQYSGLVDTSTAVEAGNLVGAQAIISGVVKNVSSRDSYFYEERSKCIDKKCKETFKYKVSCKKRVIELSADIRMIDVQSSEIIYVKNMFESSEYERCYDESTEIPSTLSEAVN